uniref:Uncharacterized protein n=1 Tax=Anopheles melas TaxID=34690 RepID=A0A182UAZ0_9DIPT
MRRLSSWLHARFRARTDSTSSIPSSTGPEADSSSLSGSSNHHPSGRHFDGESLDGEQALAIIRRNLKSSAMDTEGTHFDCNCPHIFVVFGASVSVAGEQTSVSGRRVTDNTQHGGWCFLLL